MKKAIPFLLAICCIAMGAISEPFLSEEDLLFLEEMTQAVLEASRVPVGMKVGAIGPNTTGGMLIRPGGRNAYPAFWIRDYAMSLDAGYVSSKEQRHMLFLTAEKQIDSPTVLPTGSELFIGAIADHISFEGVPIFFPGVLQDYEIQGGERWGHYACLDDHFYFIHMANVYYETTHNTAFLAEKIREKTLLSRLEMAYNAPPSRPESGIVYTTKSKRGVNFGFFDTTIHTGDLFFCSLLKYQAAHALAELMRAVGETETARAYEERAACLKAALPDAFRMDDGLFRASTGLSAQPDVWGTAYAVYLGALSGNDEAKACQRLTTLLRQKKEIAWRGGVRHIPMNQDFNKDTAWEKSYAAKNRYQNGAYWNTPVGWLCYAVAKEDYPLAQSFARDYLKELRADDFRKGEQFGAPWECMHWEKKHRQNPVYLTSVTCPLAAFRRIQSEQNTP